MSIKTNTSTLSTWVVLMILDSLASLLILKRIYYSVLEAWAKRRKLAEIRRTKLKLNFWRQRQTKSRKKTSRKLRWFSTSRLTKVKFGLPLSVMMECILQLEVKTLKLLCGEFLMLRTKENVHWMSSKRNHFEILKNTQWMLLHLLGVKLLQDFFSQVLLITRSFFGVLIKKTLQFESSTHMK